MCYWRVFYWNCQPQKHIAREYRENCPRFPNCENKIMGVPQNQGGLIRQEELARDACTIPGHKEYGR